MTTEKDHVSTSGEERAVAGEAQYTVNAADLALEVKVGLDDLFEAVITQEEDSLLLAFTNGQKFRLSIAEVA